MESRSPGACATATGPDVRMQPDKASAEMAAMIGNRNARATRTGAIPHSETAPVLHRLWLTNRFFAAARARENSLARSLRAEGLADPQALRFDQALTPTPIG